MYPIEDPRSASRNCFVPRGLLAGAIGTAVVSIALTPVVVPLQRAAYASVYAQLGPWRATEAAVIFMI
jgi:hypothetical protein